MSDDLKNASSGIPPKLIIRRPGAKPSEPPPRPAPDTPTVKDVVRPATSKKQTTRLDLAAAEAPTLAKAKKQTSRISLETAAAEPQESVAPGILESAPAALPGTPQTIKIKRPAQVQAPKISQPIEMILNRQSTSMADVERISLKKQTSRISLESALTPEESNAPVPAPAESAGPAPSTIKIKRPGKAPGIAPIEESAEAAAIPLEDQPTISKSQTSKIDTLPPTPTSEEGGQATQRKTIKIRRADGSTPPTIQRPAMRVAPGGGMGATGPGGMDLSAPVEETSAPEQPLSKQAKVLRLVGNIVISIAASLAVIASGALIYILTLEKFDW